jgi:hypothetical protein
MTPSPAPQEPREGWPASEKGTRPGTTDRFQAVRDAFAANFHDHGEVGAALCVYLRGRRVVGLWGGIADLTTGTPCAEDTLQYITSPVGLAVLGATARAPTPRRGRMTMHHIHRLMHGIKRAVIGR